MSILGDSIARPTGATQSPAYTSGERRVRTGLPEIVEESRGADEADRCATAARPRVTEAERAWRQRLPGWSSKGNTAATGNVENRNTARACAIRRGRNDDPQRVTTSGSQSHSHGAGFVGSIGRAPASTPL